MMSDQALRGYEKYIQSERNLQETLNILPQGSEDYLFIKLIHTLNEKGVSVFTTDEDIKSCYKQLKDRYYSNRSSMLKLRESLLTYDTATEDKIKEEALNRLKDFVNWNFDHIKPSNLKKIKKQEEGKVAGAGEDETSDEEEHLKAFKSEFQQDAQITKATLIDNFISNNNAQQIHPRYFSKLDYSQMKNHHRQFDNFVQSGILPHIDFKNDSFNAKLKEMLKEDYYKHYYQVTFLTSKYDIDGLMKLYKNHSQFKCADVIREITQRTFHKVFCEGNFAQDHTFAAQSEIIHQIEEFVTQKFGKDSDLTKTARYFQLILLYKQNKYDEKLFEEWIKEPHWTHSVFIFDYNNQYNSPWNNFFQRLNDKSLTDGSLVDKIIEANFEYLQIKKGVDLKKKFSKYIRDHNLDYFKAKIDYLNNLKVDDNSTAQSVVNQLQHATYIELCHYNPTTIPTEEDLQIHVDLKNIPKLQVKLFEINLDNYFRQKLAPFTSDINLDGLIAKYEKEYDYKDLPSNLRHTEIFKFDEVKGQRGLFVIELIGNGISSRAVIQRGNLSLIVKSTIAGQFAFILDENKKICKGKYTGLYFDNNFYASDLDSGRIIIPFGRHQYRGKAIMINEGFAQLTDFEREDERYQFNASIILHSESVIMGNLAKILVKPQLVLNERELADMRLLENTKVTLQTVNQVDNITISKSFEDVKLNDQEEYEIEFQVPPNIAEIKVTVSTMVVSKGEKKNFSTSEAFTINNHSNDHDFCEVFLRNVENNYQYLVRGKNGEPKRGVLIDFRFKHKYYVNDISAILKTDKDGIVSLGRLKNIKSFTATPRSSRIIRQIQKVWVLPETTHLTYPRDQTLTYLTNEKIKFPFSHGEVKPTNFQLLHISQEGTYIQNRFASAKLIKNPNNKHGVNYLEIEGLEEGQYTVWLKKEDIRFYINVHRGDYWENTYEFLIKERSMIERTRQRIDCLRIDEIQISNVEIEAEEQKKTVQQVVVKLGGDYNKKKARIHAWAFKFFPYDIHSIITEKLGKQTTMSIYQSRLFNFAKWKNIFLSNRQLSDENRYIMERKMQEKTIGNFLEKPTVLLKRNYIRDTTFQQEKLNQGGAYDRVQAEQQSLSNLMAAPARARMEQFAGSKQREREYIPNPRDLKQIEGFHNFLAHSAETFLNVKVEDGVAEFEMNLEPYTTLLIAAVSEDQSTHQFLPLSTAARINMPQRDLSLLRAYNSEKSFSETRRTTNCLKAEKFLVEDITSTDMQIVDSLQKVWLVQKELKKFNNEEQEFIDNMLKWPSNSQEDKAKKYSEYCSHEFNVFLKLKDQTFFENAVRPFLTNKMEKTFVDYWLLDMDFALNDFLKTHKLDQLNVFEQCLMIHFLMKKGGDENVKRAKELADAIRDRNNPPSIDSMNRIYDIVLNMNSLNSKPSDDVQSMLMEEKARMELEKRAQEALRVPPPPLPMSSAPMSMMAMAPPPPPPGMMMMMSKAMAMPEARSLKKMSAAVNKKKSVAKMAMFEEEESLCDIQLQSNSFGGMEAISMDYESMQQVRQTQKLTFKELDNTKEYAETHYFKIKNRSEHKNLIKDNCLWVALAHHLAYQGGSFKNFLSSNFTLALSNLNETALAFAVIDLPFKEESHGFRSGEGRSVEIKAASNMIIFLKEIMEAETNMNKNLLVVHRYFEKDKMEREVQEFLVNEVYVCQVIVTNISNKSITFQALHQIPEGALPINRSHYQKSLNFSLNAFSTMQFTFNFYFPKTGLYNHFPTNISIDRLVVAKAPPGTLKVQKTQTQVNEDDFDDILATGSVPNIINFMRTKNILSPQIRFNLNQVYWLCKDPTFYNEAIQILKSKNMFDHVFWSYAIFHKDQENMRAFFSSPRANIMSQVGPCFTSSLVTVNSHEDSHAIFNFLDYYPLVNARAHRVGGMDSGVAGNSSNETKQWILNQNLRETYMKFMYGLAAKKQWTAADRLMFVNYLIMQERITEAVTEFAKIKEETDLQGDGGYGDARIQYDYIKAYLDFYVCGKEGSIAFPAARAIVGKYINYPVLHWRVLFKEIAEQLKEIDQAYNQQLIQQEDVKFDNFEDTEQERKRKQVKMEPQMDFTIDTQTKSILIDYINVSNVTANYYLIDLEILFSKTPFISSDGQDFSFVQPFYSEHIPLDPNQTTFKFPIPSELATRNLVIEVAAKESNGLKQLKTYFSATLKVRVIENFGELKVFIHNESGQDIPLPKTYVKVYSKKVGGSIQFFKDGYTDLRGRFDYGQLSGTSISDVEKFSIFVQNEQHGSMIKEAKPPAGAKK